MKTSEHFALSQWLTEYPIDATYEEVLKALRDERNTWVSEDIDVWEVVENHPLDQVADLIEDTRKHFESVLEPSIDKCMIKHFDITIYKHKIELIFDLTRNIWYALHPKYGKYVSGEIGRGRFERNHNFLTIGTREYELVIDCDDDQKHWESWSIFDIKKQDYLPINGKL